MPYVGNRPPKPPKDKIIIKILQYFFFNFILTISPILINLFISFTNQIEYKEPILYCPDICFMTIVTGSSSIKDSFKSRTIRKNGVIYGGVLTLNILSMILSAIMYANIAKDELALAAKAVITNQQFICSLICYILLVAIGMGIQIGGGIDE